MLSIFLILFSSYYFPLVLSNFRRTFQIQTFEQRLHDTATGGRNLLDAQALSLNPQTSHLPYINRSLLELLSFKTLESTGTIE